MLHCTMNRWNTTDGICSLLLSSPSLWRRFLHHTGCISSQTSCFPREREREREYVIFGLKEEREKEREEREKEERKKGERENERGKEEEERERGESNSWWQKLYTKNQTWWSVIFINSLFFKSVNLWLFHAKCEGGGFSLFLLLSLSFFLSLSFLLHFLSLGLNCYANDHFFLTFPQL